MNETMFRLSGTTSSYQTMLRNRRKYDRRTSKCGAEIWWRHAPVIAKVRAVPKHWTHQPPSGWLV